MRTTVVYCSGGTKYKTVSGRGTVVSVTVKSEPTAGRLTQQSFGKQNAQGANGGEEPWKRGVGGSVGGVLFFASGQVGGLTD